MTRRRERHREPPQEHRNFLPLLLGIAGVLILVVGGGIGLWVSSTARDVDRVTGCPTDAYDNVTVVLVDLTDGLAPVQTAALRNALMIVRDETPKYGRLEIYPLEPTTKQVIAPLYVGCNPGSSKDVDNDFTGNRVLADRVWNRQFGERVDAVVTKLSQIKPQNSSPLLEGIQSVAITAFGVPKARGAQKRLVIVSDMLHHTQQFSLYQGAPAFQAVSTSQYLQQTRPDLRDTDVDVHLVVRNTRRDAQKPPLYKFWVDLFEYSGGYLKHWEPLQ
jgi:hypothetical protein